MKNAPIPPAIRTPREVGFRLAVLRRALGRLRGLDRELTQVEVCAAITVQTNTWNQWEKGRSFPDVLSAGRLCEEFGVDMNYIYLGRVDSMAASLSDLVRSELAEASRLGTTQDAEVSAIPKRPRTKREQPAPFEVKRQR